MVVGGLLRTLARGALTNSIRRGAVSTALRGAANPRNLLPRLRGYRRLPNVNKISGLPKASRLERTLTQGLGRTGRVGYLGYKGVRNAASNVRNYWRSNNFGPKLKRAAVGTGNYARRGAKSIYRKISADPAATGLGIYQATRTPTLELKLAGNQIGNLSNPPSQETIFNTRAFSSW